MNWISTKDALPPIDEAGNVTRKHGILSVRVLVVFKGVFYFARYSHEHENWQPEGGYYGADIKHWLPLELPE